MAKENSNEEDPNKSDDSYWDKYREHHEPLEHWELRREFLKQNKDGFTENRLLCLSKTFANMEFLGCKYPMETMEQVAELSRGIVEDYRERKTSRIQRTFVKASDAAERKTKGNKSKSATMEIIEHHGTTDNSEDDKSQDPVQKWPVQTRFILQSKVPSTYMDDSNFPYVSPKNVALQSLLRLQNLSLDSAPASVPGQVKSSELLDDTLFRLNSMIQDIQLVPSDKLRNNLDGVEIRDVEKLRNILKGFFIMRLEADTNEMQILTQSFAQCFKQGVADFIVPKTDINNAFQSRCDVFLGDAKNPCFLAHGLGPTKKEAKLNVAVRVLKFLQSVRPTIIVKDTDKRRIEKCDVIPDAQGNKPKLLTPQDLLNSKSKAVAMMKKWGWNGMGLGRHGNGRLFPVDTSNCNLTRAGLGTKRNHSKYLEANVSELLRLESESLYDYDIEFSPDFTSDERKVIHRVAETYGFKNKSYGSGENRRVVIARKLEPHQIFEEVMKLGGENFKYKVILPSVPDSDAVQ